MRLFYVECLEEPGEDSSLILATSAAEAKRTYALWEAIPGRHQRVQEVRGARVPEQWTDVDFRPTDERLLAMGGRLVTERRLVGEYLCTCTRVEFTDGDVVSSFDLRERLVAPPVWA